jgi:hypothetical protein
MLLNNPRLSYTRLWQRLIPILDRSVMPTCKWVSLRAPPGTTHDTWKNPSKIGKMNVCKIVHAQVHRHQLHGFITQIVQYYNITPICIP